MTCVEAEELLLESFDGPLAGPARLALEAHVGGCAACSSFATRLRVADAELASALVPSPVPVHLTQAIRARVRRERVTALTENLPELIHFTGCGVATLLSAVLLPVAAPVTIAVGILGTCLTYGFLALVRSSIEAFDQADW